MALRVPREKALQAAHRNNPQKSEGNVLCFPAPISAPDSPPEPATQCRPLDLRPMAQATPMLSTEIPLESPPQPDRPPAFCPQYRSTEMPPVTQPLPHQKNRHRSC